ncbi:MRN complex-interacting protein [Bombyx mandarina]|uniref:MRN complex-interacting protein n=1 Tax=Bombyx mandarina TaxID=7092 RepID=A0A6J2JGX7_BOMMA|nr:MRN complex-interacting protein [Bombyx mandarina]
MPQLFQVLRCYKCSVFQVHQGKKSNKWKCKLCGEKQSIKRHYGLGTSKDCRIHVQKLNGIRGVIDELYDSTSPNESIDENTETEITEVSNKNIEKKSKWTDFTINNEIENIYEGIDDNNYPDNQEVISELPNKRKKTKNHYKNKNKEQITINLDNEFCDPRDGNPNFNDPLDTINKKNITPTEDSAERINSDNELECQGNELFNDSCILKDTNLKISQCKKFCNSLEIVKRNKLNNAKSQVKESKWKQFIENNENLFKIEDSKHTLNQRKTMEFSITEESDLDTILDI